MDSIDRVMQANGRMLCSGDWETLQQQLHGGETLIACIREPATKADKIIVIPNECEWQKLRDDHRNIVLGYFSTENPHEFV